MLCGVPLARSELGHYMYNQYHKNLESGEGLEAMLRAYDITIDRHDVIQTTRCLSTAKLKAELFAHV